MNHFIYLSGESKPVNGWQSTAILVSMAYWKNSGLMLNIDGVRRDKNDPPGNFQAMPMSGPELRHKWDATMTRNNKKAVEQHWANVVGQIEAREGKAWELVKEFAAKHGMQIPGEEATTKNPDAAAG